MRRAHSVRLLNLPKFAQADLLDSMCTYNSCATLLCSIRPEYKVTIGEWSVHEGRRRKSLDPIVRSALRPGELPQDVIARWFCRGLYVREAHRLLNRAMQRDGHRTRFVYREEPRHDRTFDRIAASVEMGLPVLVGWVTEDLGNHCVVAYGWSRGDSRWLYLSDPGGDERLTWESLRATMTAPLRVIYVDDRTHVGPRPDRVREWRGGSRTERWEERDDGRPGYVEATVEPQHIKRPRLASRTRGASR